jgi:hypothetical protein
VNQIVPADTATRDAAVYKPSRMLDPTRFEYLTRISNIIADSELVPLSLKAKKKRGSSDWEEFEREKIFANVFLVVEQADRWGVSPFALIQAASIVHGKLCFEGKVIAGILDELFGIALTFEWNGQNGEQLGCRITGVIGGQECVWPPQGIGKDFVTVAEWKTTGDGSPWQPKNYPRQMRYRGSREWVRIYKPALLLGVFSDDEITEIAYEGAAQNARRVAPLKDRLQGATPAPTDGGFSADNVQRALPDARQVPMEVLKDREPVEAAQQKEGPPARQQRDTKSDEDGSAQADRNGPDAAKASSEEGSKPAADSGAGEDPASRGAPTDVGGGAGAGSSAGTAPAPKDGASYDFKAYSEALMRATQDKSLKQFDADYRNTSGWTTDEAAIPTLRKIYAVHSDRIKKKTDLKQLDADLRELGAR